jgi:hypothetical protein
MPDHNVLRFNIAMHDACLMCRGQRIGCLDSDIENIGQLQRLARRIAVARSARLTHGDALSKCFAIDELSGDKVPASKLTNLMNGDDVRMIQC